MNKKLTAFLLAALTVFGTAALTGCSAEEIEVKELMTDAKGMKTLDLNGKWDFFRDEKATVRVIAGCAEAVTPVTVKENEIASLTLTLPRPEEIVFPKLTVTASFTNDIANANGAVPAIFARVNEGEWYRTDLTDYTHNPKTTIHEIDVGVCLSDLKEGDNVVQISSNITSGSFALLAGPGGNGTSGIAASEGAVVKAEGDFAVEFIYYPVILFGSSLREVTVPGVWETQLEDGADYTAYNGVGWYRTTFDLPKAGENKQYVLNFDAIDYYAEVWLNDRFLASHEDGYTRLSVDLSQYGDILRKKDNVLTVRVTDQDTASGAEFPLKETLAGFFHDSVGINFAGIWNSVYLNERGLLRVTDITVEPDISSMEAKVTVTVKNASGASVTDALKVTVTDQDGKVLGSADAGEITAVPGGTAEKTVKIKVEGGQLWETSSPVVYQAVAETASDRAVTSFGFTSVGTKDGKILFNGRAIKLNGILSWLGNWDQISPLYDDTVFRTQIRQLKEYGFNTIKFCLVVPPEKLLDICDEEGIYVYIEYPVWNPIQTDAFYERAYSEITRMVNMSKNHPSVVMSDFNCEMGVFDNKMTAFMAWCVETGKKTDTNRLFTDNSSCGQQLADAGTDFWTFHPYTDARNFADYAKNIVSMRNGSGVKPVVFGEYADYPALADFDKIKAANGGGIPWNWDVVDDPFRADLYFANLGYSEEQIARMIKASQQNSRDMKMYYVQETKKADGVAAYFLTIIQDIGHSVAGFFDELGDMKFDPADTTFLKESALLLDKTVLNYVGGEETALKPSISHYDGTKIEDGVLSYRLLNAEGTEVDSGDLLNGITVENGSYEILGDIKLTMPEVDTAEIHTLILALNAKNGYKLESKWEIRVYPKDFLSEAAAGGKKIMYAGDSGASNFAKRYPYAEKWSDGSKPDLLVAFGKLTSAQLTYLKNGGKVLYFGTGSEAVKVEKGTYYSQYVMVNFPIEDHPVVKALASDGFGGLQFLGMQTEYVITEDLDDPLSHSVIGKVLLRDNVPDSLQTGSYVSELPVGGGDLMQCTLNVAGDSALGNYLIDEMVKYLLG
ncbi:MAG: beta galactosidase jelly roll domain-containing protein [Lachnospiraceae bacterium]|nr:beta galactosidase jelly roll domain-containing protein [Lachnospiraceae bacterium]